MAADAAPVVVVIGMRGAGKTTLGAEAAKRLGFSFTDLDEAVSRANDGKLPPQLVQEQGWPGFRRLELEALDRALAAGGGKQPSIIACGGGIVETPAGLEKLEKHWPVVMIDRHIDDIVEYLLGAVTEGHRASLGEHPRDTYARRLPRYLQCADFRFPVCQGPQPMQDLGLVLGRFILQILGRNAVHIGPDTFFVSLTMPDYTKADPAVLRAVVQGADVLEFRVDLLASLDHANVAQQLAALRREARGAPVLYTVRTKEHGGAFNGSEDEYFELVHLGHQLGSEMLDLECTWSSEKVQEVVGRRGRGSIVGSFHDFHRMPPREELRGLFAQCTLGGAAAIAKVVVKPEERSDNFLVQELGEEVAASSGCAFIGLCLGDKGKLSRVLNRTMCPATHKALAAAAPGQLSAEDILACRRTMALLAPPQQYPIVGQSDQPLLRLLPALHCAAFGQASLPEGSGHACPLQLADHPEDLRRLCSLTSVGGIAVAGAALQQALASSGVCSLSADAKATGAVDTVVFKDGKSVGENCLAAAIRVLLNAARGNGRGNATGSGLVVAGTAASTRLAAGTLKAAGFEADAEAPAKRPKVASGSAQHLSLKETGLRDLASTLEAFQELDVLVLADTDGEEADASPQTSADPSAWSAVIQALKRLAPVVVDAGCSPQLGGGRRLALIEEVQAAGCQVVEGPEVLVELTCQRVACWTGASSVSRPAVAAELLRLLPPGAATTAGRSRMVKEESAGAEASK